MVYSWWFMVTGLGLIVMGLKFWVRNLESSDRF